MLAQKTAQPIPNPCSSVVLQTIGMLLCRDEFSNFTPKRKGAKAQSIGFFFAPLRLCVNLLWLRLCRAVFMCGEFSENAIRLAIARQIRVLCGCVSPDFFYVGM